MPSDERLLSFQEVSIVRPGKSLPSDIGRSFFASRKSYWATMSWLRHPQSSEREAFSYTLTIADIKGVAVIGAADLLVKIAQEVKYLRQLVLSSQ